MRRRSACGCEIDDQMPHGGLAAVQVEAGEDDPSSGTSLCDLRVGSHARVVEVRVPGVPALEHRLADLGFVPGAAVDVLRRAPLGDPVVYRVCDYELCLRHEQAARVFVADGGPSVRHVA